MYKSKDHGSDVNILLQVRFVVLYTVENSNDVMYPCNKYERIMPFYLSSVKCICCIMYI